MPKLELPSSHIGDDAVWELPAVAFAVAQGEMDSDILSALANEDLANRDWMFILGIMCSPHDASEAVRLNNALTANELYEAGKLIDTAKMEGAFSVAAALAVADRESPKEIAGDLLHHEWLAHVACGYILRWIISRHENPQARNQASLTEAARRVEEWCTKHQIVGGKIENVIRNLWRKYRCVAHLWAAFYVLNDGNVWELLPASASMSLFLGTAQWLFEQGARIVPRGRRHGDTVLSAQDAWTIPDTYVQRTENGAVGHYCWNRDPDSHDIGRQLPPVETRQV
jgi:hypothetical protein